jgi:lycopene beta-cyclase
MTTSPPTTVIEVDYALVGGGLQNGLLALALRAARPAATIAIIERGPALAGNHTWCFHDGDLPAAELPWLAPLIAARWPGQEVAFPELTRRLDTGYACITSPRLAEVVTATLRGDGDHVLLRHDALEVTAHAVRARHPRGELTIRATTVIDARGPDRAAHDPRAGYQKFVGHELELPTPHGRTIPMIMDATVPQRDGFRFCYILPLSPTRLLVEDTYFSDTPFLDVAAVRGELDAYRAAHGLGGGELVREETGVLPLPWHLPPPVIPDPAADAPFVAGYQGGWFHPVTGYSFPIALRLARAIAATAPRDLAATLARLARDHGRQLTFAARLNWMLFRWFPPANRHHVLARFYRLPEATIRRFYALELTALDRARIVVGRPPRGLSWRAALSPSPHAPVATATRGGPT